jgi:hypothetical protein
VTSGSTTGGRARSRAERPSLVHGCPAGVA